MLKAHALAMLVAVLWGCVMPGAARRSHVEWPDDASRRNVSPFTEAGAALAAAAAVREMVRENPYPDLFWGCSSPEQGLDVAVFTGQAAGLYYVLVDQRFERCGGPSIRVLDGWYAYAVTPQGEVVGKALPPLVEDVFEAEPETPSGSSPAPPPPTSPALSDEDPPPPGGPVDFRVNPGEHPPPSAGTRPVVQEATQAKQMGL